jgi:hypothetical protein
MNASFEKRAGLSLIIFTLLILLTMVLHPAGGNFQQLLKITPMILVTHSAAILSLPFAAIGFWGLTRRIGTEDFLSLTAFAMTSLALVAALLAATTNGLVMPIFIHRYQDATPDIVDTLRPVLTYSYAVNAAFDYVYTGAFCLGILGWSVAILFGFRLFVTGLVSWTIIVGLALRQKLEA